MRLGICPEGAVLVTDSMVTRSLPNGRVPVLVGKVDWHSDARIAFVCSTFYQLTPDASLCDRWPLGHCASGRS
jgi:hypothetical protein